MDPILERFEQRTTAELELATAEITWWRDLVSRGKTTAEHAGGHIAVEQNIIRVKRIVLGLPSVQV